LSEAHVGMTEANGCQYVRVFCVRYPYLQFVQSMRTSPHQARTGVALELLHASSVDPCIDASSQRTKVEHSILV
jgi:hypothetical protein